METPGNELPSIASVTFPVIFTSWAMACTESANTRKRNRTFRKVDCFFIDIVLKWLNN
jgi:hypothetical protein